MQEGEKVWEVHNILRKVFTSVPDMKTKSKKLVTKEETGMRKVMFSNPLTLQINVPFFIRVHFSPRT